MATCNFRIFQVPEAGPEFFIPRTDTYAFPHHMKVLKHLMGLTMKLEPYWTWMGLQPQQKHTTLLFAPWEVPSTMLGLRRLAELL